MRRPVFKPRWVPTVDGSPHLEYGLWKTRIEAVKAAQEIVTMRLHGTHASARKVYYKVEPCKTKAR